jgi:hypothetical protein
LLEQVENTVLPERQKKAREEAKRNEPFLQQGIKGKVNGMYSLVG